MNTNLNEKISENLDAELDLEQLEDVNGGCDPIAFAAVAGALYLYYRYKHRK